MKKLPTERVLIYRVVDLVSGIPRPRSEVAFVSVPAGAFDWREIGSLDPDDLGKYRYVQTSHWPYPLIDAPILRTIADRIETLNNRAQVNETLNRPTRHPSPIQR